MIEGVLADMYTAGIARVPGVLILFIHGEFDPRAKIWRLHGHGMVELSIVPVLDELRKLPKYNARRMLPDGKPSPVWARVWIRRKPLVREGVRKERFVLFILPEAVISKLNNSAGS